MKTKKFTLVEILVVVGILAILMGIGLGVMNYAIDSAKKSRTISLIKRIEVAMESYTA